MYNMSDIIGKYENCFKENRNLPALTDFLSGKTYTYFQLAAKIENNHRTFRENGIQKGDKIALIGKNSIDWICTYISVITFGATIVPILPDFNPKDVVGIINHSDSKILFADKSLLEKLSVSDMTGIQKIFCIEEMPTPDYKNFDIDAIKYQDADDEYTLVISYTSGTTGTSKGVMIPARSISHNVAFAVGHNFHFKGSHVLALLPLAHAYGCAFDMLAPLSVGSHIFVLGKIPSPKVLLSALAQVRPHLVCTVPLVMEKIIRKNIFPKLEKGAAKLLLRIPLLNNLIHNKIRKELMVAFGGNLLEMNMGGAALAPDIEKFLKKIKFPFTVGYGMTECGPLISYERWKFFKSGSCGKILPGMEAVIEGDGYDKGLGEICVRGRNVMTGYYKNPEATAEALRNGWLHTGDVGYLEKDGTLYIKGRCKSMILTSAGQNIYPEDIEGKLNNLPGVGESLVYESGGKIFALVVPDPDFLKENGGNYNAVKEVMKENLVKLNQIVAPYEKVNEIQICSESFEKTPKQSIKRFLYPKNAKFV